MATIDKDFIEYIIKSLVGKPDDVKIERTIDEKGVLLTLTVDDEDLGRVIGKRGATAQSLRTLLRALGTKHEARYNLKIADGSPSSGYDKSDRRDRRPRDDDAPSHDRRASRRDDRQSDDNSENREETPVAAHNPDLDTDFAQPEDPAAQAEAPSQPEPEEDNFAQTKKELADLDDLDI